MFFNRRKKEDLFVKNLALLLQRNPWKAAEELAVYVKDKPEDAALTDLFCATLDSADPQKKGRAFGCWRKIEQCDMDGREAIKVIRGHLKSVSSLTDEAPEAGQSELGGSEEETAVREMLVQADQLTDKVAAANQVILALSEISQEQSELTALVIEKLLSHTDEISRKNAEKAADLGLEALNYLAVKSPLTPDVARKVLAYAADIRSKKAAFRIADLVNDHIGAFPEVQDEVEQAKWGFVAELHNEVLGHAGAADFAHEIMLKLVNGHDAVELLRAGAAVLSHAREIEDDDDKRAKFFDSVMTCMPAGSDLKRQAAEDLLSLANEIDSSHKAADWADKIRRVMPADSAMAERAEADMLGHIDQFDDKYAAAAYTYNIALKRLDDGEPADKALRHIGKMWEYLDKEGSKTRAANLSQTFVSTMYLYKLEDTPYCDEAKVRFFGYLDQIADEDESAKLLENAICKHWISKDWTDQLGERLLANADGRFDKNESIKIAAELCDYTFKGSDIHKAARARLKKYQKTPKPIRPRELSAKHIQQLRASLPNEVNLPG